ncbi:hypothetical protein [Streptomyces caelestis]|uniref:hypothetical protein n=1 Tax=Streptomyces caelestis TaxID=36816 RepID=UPI00364B7DF0
MHPTTPPITSSVTAQLPSTGTTTLPIQAAQVLRTLDKDLKWRVPQDPVPGRLARKVAPRFVAGETSTDALDRVEGIRTAGHRVNAEYTGESRRDAQRAVAETEVFLDAARLLPLGCSISPVLSHIGLAVDEELTPASASRIAQATADSGRETLISAGGPDRTDGTGVQ